jgi:putative ABC transport system substrate-binding protein
MAFARAAINNACNRVSERVVARGYAAMVAAFQEGLKEVGYIDGQNVTIEYRWAEGHYDRLPDMVADFIRRQVSVIAANTPANLVAKNATSVVPIVFTTSSDPVSAGLITSLNRPGGNVTGISQLNVEVAPKRPELAHELIPTSTSVALLFNPANPQGDTISKFVQAAATSMGLQLQILRASTDAEIEAAFAGFSELKVGVLTIGTNAFFNGRTKHLAMLAVRYSVPAIYQYHEFTAAGGLISYGGSIKDSYHLAGVYTGRILKGEKPGDLPVQQSTEVELIVNLKAAKALNIGCRSSLSRRNCGMDRRALSLLPSSSPRRG